MAVARHVETVKKLTDWRELNDYVFAYYEKKGFDDGEIATGLFQWSYLATKTEKKIFRRGFERLDEEGFKAFLRAYARALPPLWVQPLHFRRAVFLVKCFPGNKALILTRIGIDEKRSMMLAQSSEEIKRYVGKIFGGKVLAG
jgi:hypothetical protein